MNGILNKNQLLTKQHKEMKKQLNRKTNGNGTTEKDIKDILIEINEHIQDKSHVVMFLVSSIFREQRRFNRVNTEQSDTARFL